MLRRRVTYARPRPSWSTPWHRRPGGRRGGEAVAAALRRPAGLAGRSSCSAALVAEAAVAGAARLRESSGGLAARHRGPRAPRRADRQRARRGAGATLDRGPPPSARVRVWREVDAAAAPRSCRAGRRRCWRFAAWLAGDGALAWCARRALPVAVDPDHVAGAAGQRRAEAAIPPSTWRAFDPPTWRCSPAERRRPDARS